MKKMTVKTVLITIASLLACTSSTLAQQDKLIENQRTNIIINTTWGDTYLGKYTPDNVLGVWSNAILTSADSFVGYTDLANSNIALVTEGGTWTMDSLQIGTTGNYENVVMVESNGLIQISDAFSVLGTNNGNGLFLNAGGTLYVESDFDATTAGFNFGSNGTLKVGGELSNMDHVEGQRHLILSGENATWNRSTNAVLVGVNSDGNSLTLEDGIQLSFTDVSIGSVGTMNNKLLLSNAELNISSNLTVKGATTHASISGSQVQVDGNVDVSGSSSYMTVSGGSQVQVDGDVAVSGVGSYVGINGGSLGVNGSLFSENNVQFSGGGELLAMGVVDMPGIAGSGTMTLSGSNARWTNNATISIGPTQVGTTLNIANNALVSTDSIEIGESGTGNSVILRDMGKMILKGNGSFVSNENSLVVDNGGWLTFGSDISSAITFGTNASFFWNTGGIVEFQGEAPIIEGWEFEGQYLELGTLFLGEGRTMILNGPNAYLPAHTNNFHLGDLSSDNTFIVTNGAQATFKSVSIGDFKEGGHNNTLLISGAGSVVTNLGFTALGGTLISGNWHEGGNNNILRVEDGASFISDSIQNRNSTGTSGLEIASGAIVQANEYYQGSGAFLTVLTDSSGTNMGMLRATTAEFEQGARVGVDAVSTLLIDTMYTNQIVEADSLIIGGVTNGTTSDLAKLGKSGGSLLNFNLILENGTNLVAMYNRRYISDGAGFNPNSIIATIADEIDILSMLGNSNASNQVNILNNMSSGKQKLEMEQLYVYQLPTYMHNQGILGGIDQVRARSSSFSGGGAAGPSGAGGPGPHSGTQEFQPWVKVYGNVGNRDADDGSGFDDGYDVQAFGTVLGIDKAFGPLLLGVAGGFANSSITGDNDDESDATTGYGLVYGTIGTNDWFGDLVLSFGITDIENESGGAFDVESDVDASQTIFYIGGGKEFKDPDGSDAVLRPMAGLQISFYDQDAYTEKSTTAVAKDVDAYDRTSYLSTLGAALVFPHESEKFNLETEFRAYWLHEFNNDEDVIDYTLVGSTTPGQFVVRSPDENIGQFGIGIAADCKKTGLKLHADLDAQFSKTYASFTLSGALLYEF